MTDDDVRNFILKFADDTKVFGKVMDDTDKCKLQEDLNKLVSWAQKWKMEFNVTKCKVMHTGNNNKFSYEMNGKVLDQVMVEKDLGIMISSDAKSSQQCVEACNKANRVSGMIRRIISYKEQWMMVNVVRPHLGQCLSVLSPHYQQDKELLRLQSVHVLRAAARLVLQLPARASAAAAMRDTLHWLSFPHRVTYKLCLLTSAFHPYGVDKSSTNLPGWGEGGAVTSVGWQITLCDNNNNNTAFV